MCHTKKKKKITETLSTFNQSIKTEFNHLAYASSLFGNVQGLQSNYLDDSSDVHLGNHLSGVQEHEQCVQCKGDILQRRVMLKCLGGVHTH